MRDFALKIFAKLVLLAAFFLIIGGPDMNMKQWLGSLVVLCGVDWVIQTNRKSEG